MSNTVDDKSRSNILNQITLLLQHSNNENIASIEKLFKDKERQKLLEDDGKQKLLGKTDILAIEYNKTLIAKYNIALKNEISKYATEKIQKNTCDIPKYIIDYIYANDKFNLTAANITANISTLEGILKHKHEKVIENEAYKNLINAQNFLQQKNSKICIDQYIGDIITNSTLYKNIKLCRTKIEECENIINPQVLIDSRDEMHLSHLYRYKYLKYKTKYLKFS